ncbi:hypothetical protein HK101_007871 [Irineochytrium annulatum]|nr:hypothetical protein HK101_007871 [Irineochytrium annulatum]
MASPPPPQHGPAFRQQADGAAAAKVEGVPLRRFSVYAEPSLARGSSKPTVEFGTESERVAMYGVGHRGGTSGTSTEPHADAPAIDNTSGGEKGAGVGSAGGLSMWNRKRKSAVGLGAEKGELLGSNVGAIKDEPDMNIVEGLDSSAVGGAARSTKLPRRSGPLPPPITTVGAGVGVDAASLSPTSANPLTPTGGGGVGLASATSLASRSKRGGKELLTEEEKRANHIMSEQKRRNLIRTGFQQLASMVPGLKGGTAQSATGSTAGGAGSGSGGSGLSSKSIILTKTVEFIKSLEKKNDDMELGLAELEEELERKRRAMGLTGASVGEGGLVVDGGPRAVTVGVIQQQQHQNPLFVVRPGGTTAGSSEGSSAASTATSSPHIGGRALSAAVGNGEDALNGVPHLRNRTVDPLYAPVARFQVVKDKLEETPDT